MGARGRRREAAVATSRLAFDEFEEGYAARVENLRRSAVRDLFGAISRPGIISLSGGMPDISSLPLDEVAECAARSVLVEGVKALQYGGSDGRVEMRRTVCELVEDFGIDIEPEDVILTAGSQQALDFLGRAFVNPGDHIIVEGPSYLGALQAFSAYEPVCDVIDMDDEGMRMDLLEAKLEELGPMGAKFIYTIPNFQNPAGVTMSLERRKRLLELGHAYGVPVVEDDPYGRLRYEGEPVPCLRSMDPDVIYLGTVSKTFAPGLRIAWIVCPRPLLAKFNLCLQGAGLCVSAFDQVFCEHYFHEVDWRDVLDATVAKYRERRDAMLAALEEFFPPEARWTHPEGGFFLWIELPPYFDTEQLLATALEAGVAYVPGSNCYPDGRGRSAMRVNFSYETPEHIRETIRRLSEAISDRMDLYRAFLAAGALAPDPSEP